MAHEHKWVATDPTGGDPFMGGPVSLTVCSECGVERTDRLSAATPEELLGGFAESVNEILRSHKPTTGMKVASGQTCECGYWTGEERAGVDRPVGVRGDGLDWHRSLLIADLIRRVRADERKAAARDALAAVREVEPVRDVDYPLHLIERREVLTAIAAALGEGE